MPEPGKEIKVLQFLSLDEIDSVYYQKTYYLSPDTIGANGYQLLFSSMNEMKKAALCQFSIRSKSTLALVKASDGCLTLTTMYYPEEIRPASVISNQMPYTMVDPKGMAMAQMLITHMSKPFVATDFHDMNRKQLVAFIEHKIAGQKFVVEPPAAGTRIIDLMAALQASLEVIKPKETKKPKRKSSKLEQTDQNSTETA